MKKNKINTFILAIASMVICVIFIARIAQLSLFKTVNHVDLVNYTRPMQERSSITQARRGTIFDSKGHPIAMDTTSYSLFAILENTDKSTIVKDYDYTAKVLANYLSLSRDEILELLRNPHAQQIEFGTAGRNLSVDTKEAIEALNLPGIYFTSETARRYVNDFFASHLIGYAKLLKSENTNEMEAPILSGELGIELAYNKQLSGMNRYQEQWNEVNNLDYLSGEDVYLTLDSRLQNTLEDLLNNAQMIYQPKQMGGYLVEVKTGKLLAAAQRPTFNLNTRVGIDQDWKNYLVEEAFEPGSTIKILSMGIAKDNQLYQLGEQYQSGTVDIYDTKISDHNNVGWGRISFEEGLARSSNTAMVTLAQRLGDEQWIDALGKFGFGKTTNSLLPNEAEGNFTFDNPVSRYMSSFGQAFSATPIQLMQAFTSVANQGKMLKIQYIEGIGTNQNQYQPEILGYPMTETSANDVLKLMINTVEADYGTAKPFKSNLVKIAAKTGTAQIANDQGTGYLMGERDYLHSVVAFFPADNPQFMMYLFMKQPGQTNGLLGSQILAQTFHPFLSAIYVNLEN